MPDASRVDVGACRCRIVGVAQVVDKTAVQVGKAAGEQLEVTRDGEVIVQTIVPVRQCGECVVVVHFVMGIPEVGLKEALQGQLAVHPSGHAHALAGDAEIYSGIFLRRQIGVEYVRDSLRRTWWRGSRGGFAPVLSAFHRKLRPHGVAVQ